MKATFKIAAFAMGLVSLPDVAVIAAIVAVMLGRQAVASGFEFNGIRIVKDSIVSVAVIALGDGKVALIDAGNDKSGKAILAELSRRQLTREAVSAILLTHSHPDHVGAIDLFPKAEVMALEPELPLLEGHAKWRGPPFLLYLPLAGGKNTHHPRGRRTGNLLQVSLPRFSDPRHTPADATFPLYH